MLPETEKVRVPMKTTTIMGGIEEFMFGSQQKEVNELEGFLNEADDVLTPDTLKTRAKSGCEYSSYLQHPNAHHGQVLLKGLPGKEKVRS